MSSGMNQLNEKVFSPKMRNADWLLVDSLSSSPDRSNLMAVPGIEVPSMHVERSKRFIKQAERRRPGYRMTHRARRPKKKSSATP